MIRDKWLPKGHKNNMIVVGEKTRLDILDVTKETNILKQDNKEVFPFGEDYFSHKLSSFRKAHRLLYCKNDPSFQSMEFFTRFPKAPSIFLYFSNVSSSIIIAQPAQHVSSHSAATHLKSLK